MLEKSIQNPPPGKQFIVYNLHHAALRAPGWLGRKLTDSPRAPGPRQSGVRNASCGPLPGVTAAAGPSVPRGGWDEAGRVGHPGASSPQSFIRDQDATEHTRHLEGQALAVQRETLTVKPTQGRDR